MRVSSIFGRIIYGIMTPFLGLFFSGKKRTRAIIIHESEILLVRNWIGKQKWALPGGGVKSKEPPEEAIVRELEEELSLDVHKKDLKFIDEVNHTDGNVKYPVVIYGINVKSKPPFHVRRPEIIDAKWQSLGDLPENIDELTEQVIKQQR